MTRTDKDELANAILEMTYGDVVSLGEVLSDVLANTVEGTPSGAEVSSALHGWAVEQNNSTE